MTIKLAEEFERLLKTGVQLGRENSFALTSAVYEQEPIIQSFLRDAITFQQALGELDTLPPVQEVVDKRYEHGQTNTED